MENKRIQQVINIISFEIHDLENKNERVQSMQFSELSSGKTSADPLGYHSEFSDEISTFKNAVALKIDAKINALKAELDSLNIKE